MELTKNWYVVQTYSGHENSVKMNLEKRVETMEMQDQIFQVIVPEETVEEVKDGKKKTYQRKIFPGYVLVELIMTDASWYVVRNTPNVTGFLGSSGGGVKPTPLLPEEVESILQKVTEETTSVDLSIGDEVEILSGPFEHFQGKVQEVDLEIEKATVLVDMFGRETKVELEFEQVRKVS